MPPMCWLAVANETTSGCCLKIEWTVLWRFPMPLPWMIRTLRIPRSRQAKRYSSTRSFTSFGRKVCRSSTPSIGSGTGSSMPLIYIATSKEKACNGGRVLTPKPSTNPTEGVLLFLDLSANRGRVKGRTSKKSINYFLRPSNKSSHPQRSAACKRTNVVSGGLISPASHYGYGPGYMMLASNGMPWINSHRVPSRRFSTLWLKECRSDAFVSSHAKRTKRGLLAGIDR